jgi:mono/diheme cytochrome c family protein
MYYSKGYEPMTQFSDSSKYRFNPYFMTMREPVKGTVAIGQLDYQYAFDNTPEGYEASAMNSMKINLSEAEQLEGIRLFGIYCSPCHGMNGGNDGPVSAKQAVLKPAWPSYRDQYIKNLPIGKIYHVLTYGKNNMGSYAYALTPRERWSIATYVKRMSMADSLGNLPAIQVVNATEDPVQLTTADTAHKENSIKGEAKKQSH